MSGSGTNAVRRKRSRAATILLWLVAIVVLIAAGSYLAYRFSPWPSALFYRYLMDRGGVAMAAALEKHVPSGVTAIRNERYDTVDSDALLDVFFPSSIAGTGEALPTVVWIHGGGFLSGDKDQIAAYAKIIAANGYTVVGINYTLAPEARYPTPPRQVNEALRYLVRNARRLHIDPSRIVLAGDSAGAQIAAQTAALISNPAYAKALGIHPEIERKQLIGAILHCGLYDRALIRFEGAFSGFLRAVGWSYFGAPEFLNLASVAEFSVIDHVTGDFPPVFISAGNADPLLPHSLAMADALAKKGVPVDRLFFPEDYKPPLGHEYQFILDNEAGKLALERALKFLANLKPKT